MKSRRDFLKLLLATPLAATIDYEKLLWVPKPIIVVPSFPSYAELVASTWEEVVKKNPIDLFGIDQVFYEDFLTHMDLHKKLYNKILDSQK